MGWIRRHQNHVRAALLALFLVSFFGPWAYTYDGVPPAEWCAAPNILLESGRCAGLVSGVFILAFLVGAFFNMLAGLISGAIYTEEWGGVPHLREFLFTLLFVLFGLPLLTTLLQFRAGEHFRSRIFNVIAWALAGLAGVWLLLGGPGMPTGRLWGIWLYVIVAVCALLWEVLVWLSGRWAGKKELSKLKEDESDDPRIP